MPRTSMVNLIADVRLNVGSPSQETWSDDQLQGYLDQHRLYLNRVPLAFADEVSGGSLVYLTAALPDAGRYEGGTSTPGATAPGTIYDHTGSTVGYWYQQRSGLVSFQYDQAGSLRYFTGYTYDVNAASAAVLDAWAGQYALKFDFETDGQSFRRSQAVKALRELAKDFWAKSQPRSITLTRSDER